MNRIEAMQGFLLTWTWCTTTLTQLFFNAFKFVVNVVVKLIWALNRFRSPIMDPQGSIYKYSKRNSQLLKIVKKK